MNDYRSEMVRAINEAISRLDCSTVAIGDDCLWQLIRLRHGPMGTNCAFHARELYDEIVKQAPYNQFIYRTVYRCD